MQLTHLLQTLDIEEQTGPADTSVTDLFYDSRHVTEGSVFFALPGTQVDGHRFIPQAIAQGARVVVHQYAVELPADIVGIRVANARRAMAQMARHFYNDPAAGMHVIGVTGTNGKTTVCALLEQMLIRSGFKPAVIGTINYRYGSRILPASHTTPESVDMLRMLHEFRQLGADTLLMEVSSHALEQNRVDGVHFDQAIFTNLTPEHLDYHGTMDSYFASKQKLFINLLKPDGVAVINIDDPYGRRLAETQARTLTVSQKETADVQADGVVHDVNGLRGCLVAGETSLGFSSPMVGTFNLSNLLCAYAAAVHAGAEPTQLAIALGQLQGAPGRLEPIDNTLEALVLVDYAHTGDALEKVLQALVELKPNRMMTVFGCGGDRDTSKRSVMGRVAAEYSDIVIVTSDNPRTEDPAEILEQIRPGVETRLHETCLEATGAGYAMELDRHHAIERAVSLLQPGDCLLVAGKGHEDYQVLGTSRIHFDDREELKKALAARGARDEI